MLDKIKNMLGFGNERELRKLKPIVEKVNSLEKKYEKFSQEELQSETKRFREMVDKGETLEEKEDILDEILPEAFAVVREAAKRTVDMRPFDVQVMGGIVLHQAKIAEMKTGEGKTLVATMPAYLNALVGKGVHIVTVNDYLARRDAEWMGKIYKYLGLTVGVIQSDMDDKERKEAYLCDITYGTNNEFGFDYLRDNMKYSIENCVQREHFYAIIDEVDSILIDEARTPLIISGPSEQSTEIYYKVDRIIPYLKREVDYLVDEKMHTVTLTESGILKAEKLLGVNNLYAPENMELVHCINQALRAHNLFKRDVNYVVKNGEVIIVDEFTGRLMPGRRYSDGLHQALEAKEGVKIESENQTLATITLQNYFRMYWKLAGMTGTAETEKEEFQKIYGLDVVVIPTNKPMIRIDYPDVIYKTEKEKFKAIVREIEELHEKGRPILVGTVSIEKSEYLSRLLKKKGIPHNVLNAKYHEKEAEIIAQAGRKGAVTIATNMAGRGTDILLGGNPEFLAREEFKRMKKDWREVPREEYEAMVQKMKERVKNEHDEVVKLGGLHIIGSERHESRRIDNQLRGRAGRQGDPGSSRFYLSLEDDLMRIYGGEKISSIMTTIGMQEDMPIESKMITKQIERAQKQVEAQNFETRKHLLEYDDVMNKQREAIYRMRRELLEGKEQKDYILETAEAIMDSFLDEFTPATKDQENWDVENLAVNIADEFGIDIKEIAEDIRNLSYGELRDKLWKKIVSKYEEKEKSIGSENMRLFERYILLQILDNQWKDHLLALDHLKEGIGLRGYGQMNPIVEYKKESYNLFNDMLNRMEDEFVKFIWRLEPSVIMDFGEEKSSSYTYSRGEERKEAQGGQKKQKPIVKGKKIGRNDPCPCGSGKKYKNCCGRR